MAKMSMRVPLEEVLILAKQHSRHFKRTHKDNRSDIKENTWLFPDNKSCERKEQACAAQPQFSSPVATISPQGEVQNADYQRRDKYGFRCRSRINEKLSQSAQCNCSFPASDESICNQEGIQYITKKLGDITSGWVLLKHL